MRARDWAFIAFVVIVVGGLYFLSTRGRAKPLFPNPAAHTTAKTRADCLECHLPAQMAAMEQSHKHPGKWKDERVNCTACHTPVRNATSQRPGQGAMNSLKASLGGQWQRVSRWHKRWQR